MLAGITLSPKQVARGTELAKEQGVPNASFQVSTPDKRICAAIALLGYHFSMCQPGYHFVACVSLMGDEEYGKSSIEILFQPFCLQLAANSPTGRLAYLDKFWQRPEAPLGNALMRTFAAMYPFTMVAGYGCLGNGHPR